MPWPRETGPHAIAIRTSPLPRRRPAVPAGKNCACSCKNQILNRIPKMSSLGKATVRRIDNGIRFATLAGSTGKVPHGKSRDCRLTDARNQGDSRRRDRLQPGRTSNLLSERAQAPIQRDRRSRRSLGVTQRGEPRFSEAGEAPSRWRTPWDLFQPERHYDRLSAPRRLLHRRAFDADELEPAKWLCIEVERRSRLGVRRARLDRGGHFPATRRTTKDTGEQTCSPVCTSRRVLRYLSALSRRHQRIVSFDAAPRDSDQAEQARAEQPSGGRNRDANERFGSRAEGENDV